MGSVDWGRGIRYTREQKKRGIGSLHLSVVDEDCELVMSKERKTGFHGSYEYTDRWVMGSSTSSMLQLQNFWGDIWVSKSIRTALNSEICLVSSEQGQRQWW